MSNTSFPTNPPLVVNIGMIPTQLPNTSAGITVVNTGTILINISVDPTVQHNLLPIQPGSSLSVPPGGSYWAIAAMATTLNVLTGNQSYFSTSALQNQGILGAGGLETLVAAATVGNSTPFPSLGTATNIQIWNFMATPTNSAAPLTSGIGGLQGGSEVFDVLSYAEGGSNRAASIIVLDGSLIFINEYNADANGFLLVSPHS